MHGDHESHGRSCQFRLGAYASLIIPNDLRGRVFSVFSLFNITLASLASGIAGIMLSSLGYMIAAATTAAIMTVPYYWPS